VGTSPTVRQRELGRRLRELRSGKGLTVEDVAEELLCSATKISRLETGTRPPSLRDVRDLCNIYDIREPESTELMNLARGARQQGWWTKYEDLNLTPYIGLEQAATAITSYTMYYIPALLQTEDYARAIIRGIARKIDSSIHQQRVAARLQRQQVLEQDVPPRYHVLLDDGVLQRPVGGSATMAAQLDKVLAAERDGKATIQVIPFDVGAHAAQDSNFVLFEFGDADLSPVVFVEGLTKHQYYEREAEIARYREAIEYLCDSALSPQDSVEYLKKIKAQVHETVQ
jgi:transcriptional regulator with XRE-family HTH domain